MAGPGRERILAIDVVRGLAVVGMLLVNNAGIPAAMPQELRHASWQGLTLVALVMIYKTPPQLPPRGRCTAY